MNNHDLGVDDLFPPQGLDKMQWRGTSSPNGAPSPPFSIVNTSTSTRLVPLIPQSPWNFHDSRLRTPSPAPPSKGWKWSPSAPQMPRPQPAAVPSKNLPSTALSIAATVALAPATAVSSNGLLEVPTRYDQAQTTGQQDPGRTPTLARNKALPGFDPQPGSAPSNPNRPPTSSQISSPPPPPLLLQRRNNRDEVGGGGIDVGRRSNASRNPSWPLTDEGSSMAPSRSGSSNFSTMSPDWASTTVEGGDEPDEPFEATNNTPTHQAQELILPSFERLVEKRKPTNLSGKVVISDRLNPIIGAYGLIHIGNFGGRKVAVKMLVQGKVKENDYRKKTPDDLKTEHTNERRARREINVWAALKHRNICELLGFADDHHDYPAMISPWYERGSAANLLITLDLSLVDRVRLTREVCEGLQYLHRFSLVHGDLKPANVLIDDYGVARLCDFGLVKLDRWGGPSGMTTTSPYSGTLRYKPRELFIGQENRWPEATFEGDIHSLGCMMVEFIEGVRPFQRFDAKRDIGNAIFEFEPPVRRKETKLALGDVSEQFWTLLEACWHVDKSKRPDVGTVVRYLDWF